MFERIKAVHIGVDLGQTQDFSAIAVVEVGERPSGLMQRDWRRTSQVAVTYTPVREATYGVQRLRRVDVGPSWIAIAARICEVVGALWNWEKPLRGRGELQPHEP